MDAMRLRTHRHAHWDVDAASCGTSTHDDDSSPLLFLPAACTFPGPLTTGSLCALAFRGAATGSAKISVFLPFSPFLLFFPFLKFICFQPIFGFYFFSPFHNFYFHLTGVSALQSFTVCRRRAHVRVFVCATE